MGSMSRSIYIVIIYCILIISFNSCSISLKGISINPDVKTYYVEDFKNQISKGPSDIHDTFSEALRSKIRKETRLTDKDTDPDINFEGSILGYNESGQAASGNDQSAYNRLTISVKVKYFNNLNEKENWDQQFKFHKDFPTDQSLQDVEDDFIEEIFEQITEDIFNKAFTNW